MTKKNLSESLSEKIWKGVSRTAAALTLTAFGAAGVYTFTTSSVTLKPNQGAIIRELKISDGLSLAPRSIENKTDKPETFWKLPVLSSVEGYIDLSKEQETDGTFAFWTADKLTFNKEDEQLVRAFNFSFDKKIINLDSWAKWDPQRIYGQSFSSSEVKSREKALSDIIENTFIAGIRDEYGNLKAGKDGQPVFFGFGAQINLWSAQLLDRHDFLIEKLAENGLLDKLNNLNSENEKRIKNFYNNFFKENPWYVLGPMKLEEESNNLLQTYEKDYFAQYPWWMRSVFFNNYSDVTKNQILNGAFSINPPRDVMASEENLRQSTAIESQLYSEYPTLKKIEKQIEELIKCDSKINQAKSIRIGEKPLIDKLKEVEKTTPKDLTEVYLTVRKDIVNTLGNYKTSLEELSKFMVSQQGEEQLSQVLNQITSNYLQNNFESAEFALLNAGAEKSFKSVNEAFSNLEKTVSQEDKNISEKIIEDYKKYVETQTSGQVKVEQMSLPQIQQSFTSFLGAGVSYQVTNNSLRYTGAKLSFEQRKNMLQISREGLEKVKTEKLAEWFYQDILTYLQDKKISLSTIDESSLSPLMQDYVQNSKLSPDVINLGLQLDIHNLQADKEIVEAERMRREKLIPFFNDYIKTSREKEMKLWDYALNEILNGNGGIKKYKTGSDADEKEAEKIRERFVYKFMEQQAPEYFSEFMQKFHEITPYEENLGIVITNAGLTVANEKLYPGGVLNQEYSNVSDAIKEEQENNK